MVQSRCTVVPYGMVVCRAARPKVAAKLSTFQAENLGGQRNYCCPGNSVTWGAVWTAITLVPTQRCYSHTSFDMQWWRVEGTATTTLVFSSPAGWNLEQCYLCLLLVTAVGRVMEMWWLYPCQGRWFRVHRASHLWQLQYILFPGMSLFFISMAFHARKHWEYCPPECPGLAVRTKRGKGKLSSRVGALRSREKQLEKKPGFWDLFP